MGLDMYLTAQKYVSAYEYSSMTEDAHRYRRLIEMFGVEELVDPHTPSATVSFNVAYWRKANHIHKWFVDNVQDGVDECQEAEVGRAQLIELRDLCKRIVDSTRLVPGNVTNGWVMSPETGGQLKPQIEDGLVMENPAVAQELLPTTEGFFFGGTDYDEWYYRDCENTVEQLDRVLEKTPEGFWFYYQSSW